MGDDRMDMREMTGTEATTGDGFEDYEAPVAEGDGFSDYDPAEDAGDGFSDYDPADGAPAPAGDEAGPVAPPAPSVLTGGSPSPSPSPFPGPRTAPVASMGSMAGNMAEVAGRRVNLSVWQIAVGVVVILLAVTMLGQCGRGGTPDGMAGGGDMGMVSQEPAYTTLEGYFQTHPDRWAAWQTDVSKASLAGVVVSSLSVSGNNASIDQVISSAEDPDSIGDMLIYGLTGSVMEEETRETLRKNAKLLEQESGLSGITCTLNQYSKSGTLLSTYTEMAA